MKIAKEKLRLNRVTLVAVTSVNIKETLKAMEYSMRGIEFEDAVFVSHERPQNLPNSIRFYKCDKITDINVFNHYMVFDLWKCINTEYIILVHADGFVVNPESWREEFLNYDYIGAPWPEPKDSESQRDKNGNICRVGNSVSLRSKLLLELPSRMNFEWKAQDSSNKIYNEDSYICVYNKHLFEENGMKYAPVEVAKYFSHETPLPETKGIKPFAFHKYAGHNFFYPDMGFIKLKIIKKVINRVLNKETRVDTIRMLGEFFGMTKW